MARRRTFKASRDELFSYVAILMLRIRRVLRAIETRACTMPNTVMQNYVSSSLWLEYATVHEHKFGSSTENHGQVRSMSDVDEMAVMHAPAANSPAPHASTTSDVARCRGRARSGSAVPRLPARAGHPWFISTCMEVCPVSALFSLHQ